MSLSRFESPTRRNDSNFGLALDDESRDYLEQQAGVDTVHAEVEAPHVSFYDIWRDLGAAGAARPAHEPGCDCLKCRGWMDGRASR